MDTIVDIVIHVLILGIAVGLTVLAISLFRLSRQLKLYAGGFVPREGEALTQLERKQEDILEYCHFARILAWTGVVVAVILLFVVMTGALLTGPAMIVGSLFTLLLFAPMVVVWARAGDRLNYLKRSTDDPLAQAAVR